MTNVETGTLVYRQDSRRKAVRYAHGNLFVVVKRQGFAGMFQKQHIVNWMDFSQFGMAFITEHKFTIGNKLLIELTIDDVEDINKESISEVVGIITNVRKEHSGNYRYGVEFDFGANEYMKSDEVRRSLMNIEFLLKDIFYRLTEKRILRENGEGLEEAGGRSGGLS